MKHLKHLKVKDFPEWTPPIGGWQYRWTILHSEGSEGRVYYALAKDEKRGIFVIYAPENSDLLPWCIEIRRNRLSKRGYDLEHVELYFEGTTLEIAIASMRKYVKEFARRYG